MIGNNGFTDSLIAYTCLITIILFFPLLINLIWAVDHWRAFQWLLTDIVLFCTGWFADWLTED